MKAQLTAAVSQPHVLPLRLSERREQVPVPDWGTISEVFNDSKKNKRGGLLAALPINQALKVTYCVRASNI